ncbi:hypothetical protein PAECIP111893_04959 [Paenibacillus plantiphilus]|uniref:Uncharacterized protein n=1 Tax=Paenibacillus plantiphilus TaxID=2905650 RepID=A0ABM9CSS2_9BACL|nr:hypothetical protein [Paenibacillus plantiphilus]CAH1223342.1 hypothetical protein PAECIP111893_04959 [Paenibacillus plantiphilus]
MFIALVILLVSIPLFLLLAPKPPQHSNTLDFEKMEKIEPIRASSTPSASPTQILATSQSASPTKGTASPQPTALSQPNAADAYAFELQLRGKAHPHG